MSAGAGQDRGRPESPAQGAGKALQGSGKAESHGGRAPVPRTRDAGSRGAGRGRLSLRFRGSRNQRIIDLKKTFSEGEIVLWDD